MAARVRAFVKKDEGGRMKDERKGQNPKSELW
jgi:hypothetical protein